MGSGARTPNNPRRVVAMAFLPEYSGGRVPPLRHAGDSVTETPAIADTRVAPAPARASVGADVTPQTTEGRLAAMALMLLGVGLSGAITATITSYIMAGDLRGMESNVEADAAVDRANLALDRATQRAKTMTASAESPSSAGGSLVSDLERLSALHRRRDLTAEELAKSKAVLLNTPMAGMR
jgi:hypothetical protein